MQLYQIHFGWSMNNTNWNIWKKKPRSFLPPSLVKYLLKKTLLRWPFCQWSSVVKSSSQVCTGLKSCPAEMSNINPTSYGNWPENLHWQSWEAELYTIVCDSWPFSCIGQRKTDEKGEIERVIVLWSLYCTYWFIWTEVLAVRPPMTSTCSSGKPIITLEHHKSLWLLPQWNRRLWSCVLHLTESLIEDETIKPKNLSVIWKLPFSFSTATFSPTIGVILYMYSRYKWRNLVKQKIKAVHLSYKVLSRSRNPC